MSPRTTTFLLSALVAASNLFGNQVNAQVTSQATSAGQAAITATSLLPSSQSVVVATPTATVNTAGLPASALATNLPDGYSVP